MAKNPSSVAVLLDNATANVGINHKVSERQGKPYLQTKKGIEPGFLTNKDNSRYCVLSPDIMQYKINILNSDPKQLDCHHFRSAWTVMCTVCQVKINFRQANKGSF